MEEAEDQIYKIKDKVKVTIYRTLKYIENEDIRYLWNSI